MKQHPANAVRPRFPKKFLWGAATAAHQVEGGTYNQWTVWELENAKSQAAKSEYQFDDLDSWPRIKQEAKQPENYVSEAATEHYRLYREDFDLLKKMHMNAFRFSIEWSRIEPEENAWNIEAIEHYKDYLKELKARDIEPVMTLFHFTLPVWFAAKGGFAKQSNVKYFVRFAERIVKEMGSSVRLIITINEPEVYAAQSYLTGQWPPNRTSKIDTVRVLGNLAYAHREAAKAIHQINRRYKVSVAKNSVYIYPGDDARLSQWTAAVLQYFQDDYFLRKVVKHCDFLGVNYYFSDRVYGYRTHNPETNDLSDMGWDLSPANIEFVLERLWEKYHLPIIITENGLADAEDGLRKWWLTSTIIAMQKALDRGVELQGYLHWSLLDNFEWAYGKWPRFGLAKVDYISKKRELRPSAVWFGSFIRKIRSE